jgi:putative transposase
MHCKIHRDLRDSGEYCGVNRVHRLTGLAGLEVQVVYRRPSLQSGEQHVVTPNVLSRPFNPMQPNQVWVTDISYIKRMKAGCIWVQ